MVAPKDNALAAEPTPDPVKVIDPVTPPDTGEIPEPKKPKGAAGNEDEVKKPKCPEVSVCPELPLDSTEKTWAGAIMIIAMVLTLLVIIMHWPNKMPTAESTIYYYKPFRITLMEKPKPPVVQTPEQIAAVARIAAEKLKTDEANATTLTTAKVAADKALVDDNSADKTAAQTAAKKAADAKVADDKVVADDKIAIQAADAKVAADKKNADAPTVLPPCGMIQFGALILTLVAASGFLGNMVYVASSFATFVGAEKFKRSWTLWYVVKPFTASGLRCSFIWR